MNNLPDDFMPDVEVNDDPREFDISDWYEGESNCCPSASCIGGFCSSCHEHCGLLEETEL